MIWKKRRIKVGMRPDGSKVEIPIAELDGGEGPSVTIVAAVHGNEITPLRSLRLLMETLADSEVRGRVTIMPLVNVEGFNYDTRGVPLTTADLNRIYPGKEEGSLVERIAWEVWTRAKDSDLTLDLHTAGKCVPHVLVHPYEGDLQQRALQLASSSGMTVVLNYRREEYRRMRLDRSLVGALASEGALGLTMEFPGHCGIDRTGSEVGYRAVMNVLIHLGMVHGRVSDLNPLPGGPFRKIRVISPYAGLVEHVKELGEWIEEGEVVTEVYDPLGSLLGEVRAPEAGFVLSMPRWDRVWTGGMVATLASVE